MGEAEIETHATIWRTDHEREVPGKAEVAEGGNKEGQKTWKAVDRFKDGGAGGGEISLDSQAEAKNRRQKSVTQFRESAETGATKAA